MVLDNPSAVLDNPLAVPQQSPSSPPAAPQQSTGNLPAVSVKMDPVCFWYSDCVWGHPSRPVPLAMAEHRDMCMNKEELEYNMPEEVANNDIYEAPPVNRFRTNYKHA